MSYSYNNIEDEVLNKTDLIATESSILFTQPTTNIGSLLAFETLVFHIFLQHRLLFAYDFRYDFETLVQAISRLRL
jgi:hypothetical protein